MVGKSSSRSFWRDNGIGKFAISHRILRGESVASLAVKYSVQVKKKMVFFVVEKVKKFAWKNEKFMIFFGKFSVFCTISLSFFEN